MEAQSCCSPSEWLKARGLKALRRGTSIGSYPLRFFQFVLQLPFFLLQFDPIALVDMSEATFKLNTGAEIPALGFGTWQSPKGEVEKAVAYALSVGYKHVDGGTVLSLDNPSLTDFASVLLC
jgi:hypothetical protein